MSARYWTREKTQSVKSIFHSAGQKLVKKAKLLSIGEIEF